ncbi:hypothetical protein JZO70_07395 [Enterococcus sp. 669A]|uniref:Uncharacterized protein n=1 Tax=Candidatus Enterococcus moelleringii TaxID=2815325 RepID=A0ABS3L8N0_9ENTE|nr:hypothetical protein [Enterococcus sp. 669A]MBO1305979.1 hypothetical protein [Enterococcus sp. 669A]
MHEIGLNDLKRELKILFDEGVDTYPVALFGISNYYMFNNQEKIEEGFRLFLREVELGNPAKNKSLEDMDLVLELLADYYLLARNTKEFKKSVKWLPSLNAEQKRKIVSWPEKYILSYFQLIVKGDRGYFKDLKDGQEYLMDFAEDDLELLDPKTHPNVLTAIMPGEGDSYLSAPPAFYSIDELSMAKLRKIKEKKAYEAEALRTFLRT